MLTFFQEKDTSNMIKQDEAQELIEKYINLKAEAENNPKIKAELKKHEELCVRKFSYIVYMKTVKYRKFFNYDDLNQEGFLALSKAMNNYNPQRGSFFWWAHKYIDTRIARQANRYTAIRYPLRFSKVSPPFKERTIIEGHTKNNVDWATPEKKLEDMQMNTALYETLPKLSNQEREIISMKFGLMDRTPMSVNSICQKLQIDRNNCLSILRKAKNIIRENIKL